MSSPGTYYDDENATSLAFTEASIRRGFIRKVYSILMVQLAITAGFITLFVTHTPTREYFHEHSEYVIMACIATFVLMIAMACCSNVRRKSPMNFIFLFLFTVAEAFLLGTISSYYDGYEVLMAAGITAAVCLGLTIFAFQTRWDFTAMGGILFVAVIILLIFGIMAAIFRTQVLSILYASLGALIFSVYLVFDTQLMMGGKHKYAISPEEYIFAALNLYLDIINIFLFILQIIKATK